MAFSRPRPSKESPLRCVLFRLYAAMASLELAVVTIAASVLVLAWATLWVERLYGSEAARFAVYGTWWFAALLLLLALNVLAAALIRFPWRKKQTGFVVTHAGILVLLAGCLWSARRRDRRPICPCTKTAPAVSPMRTRNISD